MTRVSRTLIALLSLAAVQAYAQTPASAPGTNTPRIDHRQERQEARIQHGAASGALTAQETRRLEREQTHIAHAEARAKSDGTVTAHERRRLHRMQDGASRDIHRKRHNDRAASAPG
jgi:hypothetical protein